MNDVLEVSKRIFVYTEIICNTVYYWCVSKWRKHIVVNAFLDYYCGRFKHSNFGDDLNYYLIKELSGKHVICYNNLFLRKLGFYIHNISCIGSIVDLIPNSGTIIWGTGAMWGNQPLKMKPYKVLAVRGPLTRRYLLEQGVECPEVYGDPALLLPYLYKPTRQVKYTIGIIPHYADLDNKFVVDLIKQGKDKVLLIDLVHYTDWHDIVDAINSCDFIVSSSLHGIIVADAYGVPNVWVEFSDEVFGDGFKFRDYFASVNRNVVSPVSMSESINIDVLLKYKQIWKPIRIDLNGLINTCPFLNSYETFLQK